MATGVLGSAKGGLLMIADLARWIAANIVVIAVVTVVVGGSAPRWPRNWLQTDPIPLALSRFDTRERYHRWRVSRLARQLPEGGGVFGGASKKHLPGTSQAALADYLIEVRRAEWVHWLSLLGLIPVGFWSPWWLWLVFAVIAVAVNAPFVAILRHNRLRLLSILRAMEARRGRQSAS